MRNLKESFKRYCEENPNISQELSERSFEINEIGRLEDQISINLPLPFEKRQSLLFRGVTLRERYET